MILRARCPAKVNLLLRVVGRRPDGYHELDTVFQAVDLWDTLEARPARGLTLAADDAALPVDETNLVLRAARLLQERFGETGRGARLFLRKSIPLGAGLGGGSSDAAATLLLCNRLWDLRLGPGELEAAARELGADVPFFLRGGTARGRGRGDRVEPLPFVGPWPMLLGCPPFGIATAEVFDRASRRLTLPRNGVSVPLLSALKWPEEKDFGALFNDLEAVVFEDWPELKRFGGALVGSGARVALLSGSGSTVYGIFPRQQDVDRASSRLASDFPAWRMLPTRAVEDGVRVDGENGERA